MKMIQRLTLVLCMISICTGCRLNELEGQRVDDALGSLKDPDLQWDASKCEVTAGDDYTLPELINEYGIDVTFSSSDENVATISQTGEVSLSGAGETVITASCDKTEEYDASRASYTLTVNKAEITLSWSQEKCKVSLTGENTFPVLSGGDGLPVTYASSDEKVASVGKEGAVTLVSAGSAVITATVEETALRKSASAAYTLSVVKSSAGIAWSVSSCTATIGQENTYPTLANPNALEIQYSSSNEAVATIASDGSITLLTEGTAVITARSVATDTYESDEDSYNLTVVSGETQKEDAGLEWSASTFTMIYGENATFPTLSNPNRVTVTYSSTDEGVATISSAGKVSVVSSGTTTIIASSEATRKYNACSVFYKLTVNKAEPELSWSADQCDAVLGAENDFPTLSNPQKMAVTYKSSNENVASVSSEGVVTLVGQGTATITASAAATDCYEAATAAYTLTVSKGAAIVQWSADSHKVVLDEAADYPVLTVSPSDLPVTYSSSNVAVATISVDGAVTPLAAGTTEITASFAGNETYSSTSDTYVLTVVTGGDDGAGTYNYPSTGDSSSADDIVNTTFTRKIIITYHTDGNATVEGDYYGYVSISGNDVTVNNTGEEYTVYELRGTTTDGFLKMYGAARQALILNGVSITNKAGAAINIQNKKRTFVMVEGSNALADGSSYSETPSTEDERAAFFSEGQLVFSGSGTLTVNASGKAGITSDDYIRVMNSPTISTSSSAGHAMRGQESIRVDAGTINASTSADMKKGFSSDSLVVFNGGVTKVNITGGTAYDSDAADYTSSAGVKADKLFVMNGGTLTITNSGSGGKGINVGSSDQSNDCQAYFNGGTIDITCTGNSSNASAKGIKVGRSFSSKNTGSMSVTGGITRVRTSSSEAIECKGTIEVTGGELFGLSTSDDAINSGSTFTISGGYVCGLSTGNDGIDSNGNMYIKGGVVMAACAKSPEVGIDCNSEGGYNLSVQGGVLFVTGGLEKGATLSQTCYQASSFSKGVWYGLTVGSTTYAFKTHASAAGTPLVVSGPQTPTLKSNITVTGGNEYFDGYANYNGTYSGGSSVSLSSYSGGSSGGPGSSGGGPGGRN